MSKQRKRQVTNITDSRSDKIVEDPQVVQARAQTALATAAELIHRNYLLHLQHYPVLSLESDDQLDGADVALFQLERLVTENRQAVLESATAAYTALGAAGYNVFFLLEADQNSTRLYIGTRCERDKKKGKEAGNLLSKSFSGHFPGSQLTPINGSPVQQKLGFTAMADKYKNLAVTAVTGIPALSSEEREHFTQGLERFLDAAEGQNYRALLLAEPVSAEQLNWIRVGYETTSTQLSPLLKQSMSYGVNESESVAFSLAKSLSTSLGETIGLTETKGTNSSFSITDSENQSTTKDPSMLIGAVVGAAAAVGATVLTGGAASPFILAALSGAAGTASSGISSALLGSKTSGTSQSLGKTDGESQSTSKNSSSSETTSHTDSKTDTSSTSVGSSRQLTIDETNKSIEQLLSRIDHHLERIDEARSYGGWQTAAYFIATDTATSKGLASMFLGLMRGNTSGSEDFALTSWNHDSGSKRKDVLSWLENLTHPRFKPDFIKNVAVNYVTPAALLSGRELAIHLGLPRRSTSATTVLEVPAFGRSVGLLDLDASQSENKDQGQVMLGYLRHLWRDTQVPLHLSLNKLCYHTLITGTTGVGKTTAVMSLLAQVHQQGIPFLAIEPAKGEYRRLLGLADAKRSVIYKVAGRTGLDALRINPLVFPEGIELSDHIDRVCTVFNAAFPMYSAMPQVLEEAIFTAYEELGWDSISSKCMGGVRRFPTLRRVADLIPIVVKELGYSEEVSSNFIGALGTRLRSLCRGSLGMTLLCSAREETSNQELFESSAVVDLSSMGSSEKRALLMGVLFMRMCEKRMAEGLPAQASLRHLMVLEEAHVLLKRTSTEQSQEGSNPRGLAVESFSNALAEMRAYGQGFIIADQSASAIDDAVLRNTNTKIVMRAPFEADRVALGGALALNEEQTQQLARLENQTAVIHQSNWLEPVLCRIQKEEIPNPPVVAEIKCDSEKRQAKRIIASALWNSRLKDSDKNLISFTVNDLEKAKNKLGINGNKAEFLKKIWEKKEYVGLNELKPWINILFPKINDTALFEMTISSEAMNNHLQIMLRDELGKVDVEINRLILSDLDKVFDFSKKLYKNNNFENVS